MLPLSYSALSTYQRCARKYYWSYIKRIETQVRQVPLEFGSAWHLAMDAWHTTRELAPALAAFESAFEDAPNDRKRTRAAAKRMLTLYTERFADEVFTITAKEQWLELPLGPVLYRMRIDKVINWGGKLFGLEHKTTAGSLNAFYIRQFKPNLQIAGTVAGLKKLIDPRVSGMVVDAAWVGVNEPKYGERFLRHEEPVDAWELVEFEDTVQQEGAKIIAAGEDFKAYAPTWGACADFGGCPYRPLCMSPATVRERMIAMDYQPRKESPDGNTRPEDHHAPHA